MLGPAGLPIKIYGMATFDARVLSRSLFVLDGALHVLLYMYELDFIHRDVFVASLSAEDTPAQNIFSEPCIVKNGSS